MDAQPKLRLSRPTNHLEAILSFYVDGLGSALKFSTALTISRDGTA